ncbi:hypothetical protein [Thermomonas carbonis]|uniref:Uncharacterized protein n=1 Tax=Thermomonas carbonis TaxID=1463158 RepID=A0A7G9SR89_9GAMM|nr:hypothetical protein [Thermomonas carbonis]QNN70364.1 hypothetical protein H9L16_01620 [Thermomonas carbonis]GHB99528.1 hypothetical protein GCM10010080_10470 [Thermomonas carbonis]
MADNIFTMTRQPTLSDLGEGLAGKFAELSKRPCADKCDCLLRDLADARTAVSQLRTRLIRGDGEAA